MSFDPLISVVVPCFRQAHFLNDCVGSVIRQSHANWELLIVDDDSPDDTAAVAGQLSQADSRVRYLWKTHGGLSAARNFGLDNAGGAFIQFLDSDDLLHPDKFASQIAMLRDAGPNVVSYTDYNYLLHGSLAVRPRGRDVELRNRSALLDFAGRWEHDLSIPVHAFLLPTEPMRALGLRFNIGLPNHEDWDFWMAVSNAGLRFQYCAQVLCTYRQVAGAMTQNQRGMWIGFHKAIGTWSRRDLDPDVAEALRFLTECVDYLYGGSLRGALAPTLHSPWCKSLPWPVQRQLSSLLRKPLPPLSLRLEPRK